MLAVDRQSMMVELLEREGTVSVATFSKLLDTSEATVRRDINILDKIGKLKKVYGGATISTNELFSTRELDSKEKNTINVNEKRQIAMYAASLIEDGDSVYIDAGTTTGFVPEFLKNKNAFFVTNGIEIAKSLTFLGMKTVLLGGNIKLSTDSVIGEECIRILKKYNFNKGFFGTNGITSNEGFTTPDSKEAAVKSYAISHTKDVYILADSDKFGKIYAVTFLNIADAVIVTNNSKINSFPKKAKAIDLSDKKMEGAV